MISSFFATVWKGVALKKLYGIRKKYEGDAAKLALIDSLITNLVTARTGWQSMLALEALEEASVIIPELKEL